LVRDRFRSGAGTRAVVIACSAAAGALLVPVLAWADAADQAKALFVEARALRAADKCAEAIPLFRHALELYPAGLGSERNIAECEEQLGHVAAARRTWAELEQALAQNREPKYADWTHDADEAAARLAGRVARLTVDVGASNAAPFPTDAPAAVTVNGSPLAASRWGTPLEVDPGHYVVRYEREPQEVQALDLAPGESREVTLRGSVTTAPAAALARVPAPADPRQPLRIGGWVSTSMGVASFIGAGISGLVANDARRQLDGRCSTHTECPDDLRPAYSRGKGATAAANVLLGAGAGGVATGAVLFVLGHGLSPKGEVTVTPNGVAVAGKF
jgi:hypothetical protein